MTDFPLDPDNNVRLKIGGDLRINTRREDIKQRLRQRLLFLLGEWFRDPTDGIDYQKKVLVRDFRASFVDREIRRNILKVDGITSVSNIRVTHNDANQGVTLSVKYKDDVDNTEQELTV